MNNIEKLKDYLNEDVLKDGELFKSESGSEYLVLSEAEAYEEAKNSIKSIYEDLGLGSFTSNFQNTIIENLTEYIDTEKLKTFIDGEIQAYRDCDNDEFADLLEYHNLKEQINYLKDIYDDELFNQIIYPMLDIDKIAQECIKWDGVAHFIASYDGEEIDLDDDCYAYRVN